MKTPKDDDTLFDRLLNFVTLILSFLIIVALMLEMTGNIPDEYFFTFIAFDLFVCSVFIFEFFFHLNKAKDKKKYWRRNWIHLVASLPLYYFQSLRFLYIFRLLKILRIGVVSVRVFRVLNKLLAKGSFLYITLAAFLVMIVGSGGAYMLEKADNPSINSIGDAFWLVVATMTTVGYGDITVKTLEGKIFIFFVMIMGITLFSVFTAIISSFLVEESEAKAAKNLETKIDRLEGEIKELKDLVRGQVAEKNES